MKHLFALSLSAGLVFSPAIAEQNFGPLMTSADLIVAQSATDNLLVVDIRAAEGGYTDGHIEGSVNAPYGLFRGPAENPGQLPTEATLSGILSAIGATPDRPTVVVYQGKDITDFGAAARVYWTLKSSGISQIAILNGGINAWSADGKNLSTDVAPVQTSQFDVAFSGQWLATAGEVRAVLNGNDTALLLDARSESFWAGEQSHSAAARPGTLPQSQYFEHAGWFSGGPAIIDAKAARALAEVQGFTSVDQLISFCNTGHWAATNWFALSELASIDNVKLYPESLVGWSNKGYEMANVPGPVRNLWNQIKNVF